MIDVKTVKTRLLATLLFLVYSALRLTWRVRVVEPPGFKKALADGRPMVMAHWHGDELGIIYLLKRYRVAVITSTSKDGELMATVVRLFGSRTSRGSSTRGGVAALKGLLRLAKEGWRPSVAVDGPKGPLHKVKPGVFEVSKLTRAEIFPIAAAADRQFVFKKSWNQSFLPLPFARVVVVWGEGLPAVTKDADCHAPELAAGLERAIYDAKLQALNLIAGS